MRLSALIPLFQMANAKYQTVYSSDFSIVYIQFNNGSLFELQIPANAQSSDEIANAMREIAPAPTNSSLVLSSSGQLFALWGSSGCYSSPIEISLYNNKLNNWGSVAQSSVSQLWYTQDQAIWLDRNEEVIYLYGGSCDGITQSGFFRYSLNNETFERVEFSNGIQPHAMAGAQTIPLNDYQTLLLGGRASENAWISTQQLAIWGQASWSFDLVGNSTHIDSREDPLLLPIWEKGTNGTSGFLSQILVIGGHVAGRAAEPQVAALNNSPTQGWYWSVPNLNTTELTSAAALFSLYNTLANANVIDGVLTFYSRSAQTGDLWSPTQRMSVPSSNNEANSNGDNNIGHKKSPAVIAVVSTLLPIIVVALVVAGAWYLWRRRREHLLFTKSSGNRRLTVGSFESTENPFSDQMAARTSYSRESLDRWNDEKGSILLTDDGNQMFMKKKRSLRVVNPDDM